MVVCGGVGCGGCLFVVDVWCVGVGCMFLVGCCMCLVGVVVVGDCGNGGGIGCCVGCMGMVDGGVVECGW